MNIVLEGAISSTKLEELSKAYNELEKEGGAMHIFFQSEGGDVTAGEAMIELINKYALATTMTIYGLIASMGFVIAAKVACSKKILDSTYAICHLSRWGTQVLEGGKPLDDFAKFKEKHMKKILSKSVEFYESMGLKEDEIQEMKEGKDVFIAPERLKKMIK